MSRTTDLLAIINRLVSPTRSEVAAEMPDATKKAINRALEQLQVSGRISLRAGRFAATGGGYVNLSAAVDAALRKAGGASIAELAAECGCTRDGVTKALQNIRWKRKETTPVFTRKLPGMPYRLFMSEPEADAWVASFKVAAETAAKAATVKRMAQKHVAPPKMAPLLPTPAGTKAAPVTIAPLPTPQVSINPNGVRKVVLPATTHDPRYQVDPATRVEGGFAAAGIGRYL